MAAQEVSIVQRMPKSSRWTIIDFKIHQSGKDDSGIIKNQLKRLSVNVKLFPLRCGGNMEPKGCKTFTDRSVMFSTYHDLYTLETLVGLVFKTTLFRHRLMKMVSDQEQH